MARASRLFRLSRFRSRGLLLLALTAVMTALLPLITTTAHGETPAARHGAGGAAFCAASRAGPRGGDGACRSRTAACGLDGHRK